MNTYENTIQESLENIQTEPGEALRARVMKSAVSMTDSTRIYRRRLPVKVAVIAAVIAAFLLTSAFAYGSEIVSVIKQIMFGDSIATQVVSDSENPYVGGWGVMDREDLSEDTDYPLGLFDTLEEARQAVPFTIREPSYLPDNVTGLRDVGVWRVEDPDNPWMHFVNLSYSIALKNGGESILQLMQIYGGSDAYLDIESVSPIEKVMVGETEAVLVSAPEKFLLDDGSVIINDDIIGYTLYWIKDGIAYELSADYHDGYTPDTMIRIAESIN